jgi:hypothetical protein
MNTSYAHTLLAGYRDEVMQTIALGSCAGCTAIDNLIGKHARAWE